MLPEIHFFITLGGKVWCIPHIRKPQKMEKEKKKNILGEPKEARKPWNLKVKPGVTLVLRWTLFLLLSCPWHKLFPWQEVSWREWVMSKNSSSWRREERALHHPQFDLRPALCPQITLSSVCQVPPESTVSLKGHANRKLSGLLLFLGKEKESACYLNTETPAPPPFMASRAPIVLKVKFDNARTLLKIFPWPPHCLQDKQINVPPPSCPSCASSLIYRLVWSTSSFKSKLALTY